VNEPSSSPGKPWSGVFQEATDSRVERFSESVSFDSRLAQQDIRGSIAHARMLASVGLLTGDEAEEIASELTKIGQEIADGTFVFRTELEDVHMNIERTLTERLGDVGRKLHTARSRNDQVATDFRLWVRDAIDKIDLRLLALQAAFVERCEGDMDVVLPGYTHLQRAQPVAAPHYWLAYCEKFERDRQRLADCRKRVNISPLGAAALAGTTLPIDRQATADALDFAGVMANSIDAVSDRDFAIEFVFDLVMIATHLSVLAEEWILWTTSEFQMIQLPQTFCTGSSIMPQKINPDVLELIRGKTARVVGSLQTLLVLCKGLPLAYNRDLQEDKPPVFDAAETVMACLELAAPLVAGTKLRRESIAARLDRGHLDATSLMEELIRQGIPQRTAHGLVGRMVRTCLDRSCRLEDLTDDDLAAIDPAIGPEVRQALGVGPAVRLLTSYGSGGPDRVREQIGAWRQKLGI
jgi:argininosuccinate lyase